MDHYELIRRKHVIDGLSIGAIALKLGHSRQTIRKVLACKTPPGYQRGQPVVLPVMGEVGGLVDAWRGQDRQRPAKQRHTAQRIYERLRDEHGFKGSASAVRRHVAKSETMPAGLSHHRWRDGFRLAHADAELAIDPSYVHVTAEPFNGGRPAAEAFMRMTKPPTAWLIPDARTAASFIHAMQVKQREIAQDALIIGNDPQTARFHGVEHLPRVYYCFEQLARMSFSLLMQRIEHIIPSECEIIIPLLHQNLPDVP